MIASIVFIVALIIVSVFGSKGDVETFSKAYKDSKGE